MIRSLSSDDRFKAGRSGKFDFQSPFHESLSFIELMSLVRRIGLADLARFMPAGQEEPELRGTNHFQQCFG